MYEARKFSGKVECRAKALRSSLLHVFVEKRGGECA